MEYNLKNKEIWDNEFAKVPPVSDEDCCCCEDESGNYVPATPLGYDDDMKEYSAVKDIIEGAIKNNDFKTYRCKTPLVETYNEEHAPLKIYDVIYPFTSDWEEPTFPVLITGINEAENKINVAFVDYEDDCVKHSTIKYTPR